MLIAIADMDHNRIEAKVKGSELEILTDLFVVTDSVLDKLATKSKRTKNELILDYLGLFTQ